MDEVEKRITKRNEIARRKKMSEEMAHEFATLGHYREAMVDAYRNTKEEEKEEKGK
ncbi:hypothetical protein SLU01_08680 [Sporosarcina luteola]|uniref:Uncharacterized protein n=1 Tax=Sporosarcina luteola TaxID=582850 RepID=A0A511Z534_9BACL|nr:hypothetical protein [Sporosarcina luteola]GEN82556.1 hypothetical protein SLU01_08680 [Sporosarcina luteola]